MECFKICFWLSLTTLLLGELQEALSSAEKNQKRVDELEGEFTDATVSVSFFLDQDRFWLACILHFRAIDAPESSEYWWILA